MKLLKALIPKQENLEINRKENNILDINEFRNIEYLDKERTLKKLDDAS